MKLLRVGERGAERPALVGPDGELRDLSAVVTDVAGEVLTDTGLDRIRDLDPAGLPRIEGDPRVGPCIGAVGKVIAVGLNYSDHAAEAGRPVPSEPVLFMKATSCLAGPYDPLPLPRDSVKTDWEVELGAVIGRSAKYVEEADALDHVAGYCVVNDVSERAFQIEHEGQWVKGKSHDGFGPIGPWLVTRDEVPDPQALELWLAVNGQRHQNSSTAAMVFGVAHLVAYVSRFMSLQPGDVIATGTPSGVGMGHRPPRFLRPGDVVELGVQGLGVQRQEILASV